jgi:restriction system protein
MSAATMKRPPMPVPKYDALFNPVLEAIRRLGGSASVNELDEEVARGIRLTDEDVAQLHDERRTELQYRLAWARSYLKAAGYIDNSERGVWVLTELGKQSGIVDPSAVSRAVKQKSRDGKARPPVNGIGPEAAAEPLTPVEAEAVLEASWRDQLSAQLQTLSPQAFERLCQRLLRESGFVEVRVTGKTGDGGIDGVGIVRLGGLLGFPILFQCKRYQGAVGASAIRDFRGAMIGRADRGLVITTGTFSRDAKLEATRDGAPPIDLLDGEQLLEKLKELRLGVAIRMIEEVSIVPEFFEHI